jgi:hypothetical protein
MGLFTYTKVLSSAFLRRPIHRTFSVLTPQMPMLCSTPFRLRTLISLSRLDPLALVEEQLKESLSALLTNQQRKIIVI